MTDLPEEVKTKLHESSMVLLEAIIEQVERGTSLLRSELDGRRDLARVIVQLSTAMIALLNSHWLTITTDRLGIGVICLVGAAGALAFSLASLWRSLAVCSSGFLVLASGPRILDSCYEAMAEAIESDPVIEPGVRAIVDPIVHGSSRVAAQAFWLLRAAMVCLALAALALVVSSIWKYFSQT